MLLGAPLALEVDRQQVGAAGDEEPEDLAAVPGVAHEGGDLAEDPVETPESPPASRLPRAASASSMITPTGVSEERILRIRSRFASVSPTHIERKFLSLTQGKPISLDEALDEEGLGAPHRAADQVAHRHRRGVAAGDGAGGAREAGLDRRHAGDHVEPEAGLDVLEQPQPLGLDDLLLDRPHLIAGEPAVVAIDPVEDLAELHPGHAGGQPGELGGAEVAPAGVPVGAAHRLEVLAALGLVGALDLELARGVRAHQLRVELGEPLGDQHEDDVLGQQGRVLRPLAQVDQHRAVFRRAAAGVAGGAEGLGERQQQGHRPGRLGDGARLEVAVEQREAVGGVARQRLAEARPVHQVVGLEPLVEVAARLRRWRRTSPSARL